MQVAQAWGVGERGEQRRDVAAVEKMRCRRRLRGVRPKVWRERAQLAASSPKISTTCGSMWAAISPRGSPSVTRWPWSRTARRSQSRSASSIKWVVRISVLPRAVSCLRRSQIRWRACGSRPVVGSSRKTMSGSLTSARASVSRRFMPPEKRLDACALLAGKSGEVEQVGDTGADDRILDAEVAAIDQQIFGNGEVRINVVELRNDADAFARCLGVLRDGVAVERDLASVGRGQPEAAAQRGGLCRRRWVRAVRSRCRKAR